MAALTYLQLCNRLVEKAGITGGTLSSVVGQQGESARVVNWINEAYLNIQELHRDWLWMQADVSFQTAPNQGAYTPAQIGLTDFASWVDDSFRSYLTSAGTPAEQFLQPMDYPDFRDVYLFGAQRTQFNQPEVLAVGPDKSLIFGPVPDAQGYTITGKYYRAPSDLVGNASVPLLPARFHMLIVYEAMKSYGLYEAASETIAEGERQYNRMLQRLTMDQLPEFGIAGALA